MWESAKENEKESELLADVFVLRTFELFSAAMGLPTIKMKMQYRITSLPTQAKKKKKKIRKAIAKNFVHCPNFYLKKQREQGTTTVDDERKYCLKEIWDLEDYYL